ncbi:MAG: hypothetical protein H6767_06125 [Candidatus Peribacteria bacterium]|nr:MAG: hypothetical protein H6767_06125 [Candidatus Peribacteria bacterium]
MEVAFIFLKGGMEYSKESLDRQKKIADLQEAGVICYANNFRAKQDIAEVRNSCHPESSGSLKGKSTNNDSVSSTE